MEIIPLGLCVYEFVKDFGKMNISPLEGFCRDLLGVHGVEIIPIKCSIIPATSKNDYFGTDLIVIVK